MGVSIGQVTVPTSGGSTPPALICAVPPGATVTLSSVTTGNPDVFLGSSTAVTSTNGAPLDTGGPTTLHNPRGAATFSIYGVAGTGTHAVGYFVINFPVRACTPGLALIWFIYTVRDAGTWW